VSLLKRAELVRIVRRERSRVKPLRVEYYSLSLMGLVAIIQEEWVPYRYKKNPLGLDFDRIAERYQSLLPLILGKWRFFIESGWEPHDRLIRTCTTVEVLPLKDLLEMEKTPTKLSLLHVVMLLLAGASKTGARLRRKKKLPDLESSLRDDIYERFFFLELPNMEFLTPSWFDATKDSLYALDKIWAKDQEIFNWITQQVQKRMKEYSKYYTQAEERKKKLERLCQDPRAPNEVSQGARGLELESGG